MLFICAARVVLPTQHPHIYLYTQSFVYKQFSTIQNVLTQQYIPPLNCRLSSYIYDTNGCLYTQKCSVWTKFMFRKHTHTHVLYISQFGRSHVILLSPITSPHIRTWNNHFAGGVLQFVYIHSGRCTVMLGDAWLQILFLYDDKQFPFTSSARS